MKHRPAARPPDTIRVVVEDVPELGQRVSEAARRARDSGRAVELVQAGVAEDDHEARACVIRCMDEALATARRAAPGVEVRVGSPIELPRPRAAP
jgi:hypothetical protein